MRIFHSYELSTFPAGVPAGGEVPRMNAVAAAKAAPRLTFLPVAVHFDRTVTER